MQKCIVLVPANNPQEGYQNSRYLLKFDLLATAQSKRPLDELHHSTELRSVDDFNYVIFFDLLR
jgi:hypothetical protein